MSLFGKDVVYNCCGGRNKHLSGCDGTVHHSYGKSTHSGQVSMSKAEYKRFLERGGKAKSAVWEDGRYWVHISKKPRT